jgi:hypothetical protein
MLPRGIPLVAPRDGEPIAGAPANGVMAEPAAGSGPVAELERLMLGLAIDGSPCANTGSPPSQVIMVAPSNRRLIACAARGVVMLRLHGGFRIFC